MTHHDRTRFIQLQVELDEESKVRRKLHNLLERTVNTLRGEPSSDTLWSFHDLPDRVRGLVLERDALRKKAARLEGEVERLRERVGP